MFYEEDEGSGGEDGESAGAGRTQSPRGARNIGSEGKVEFVEDGTRRRVVILPGMSIRFRSAGQCADHGR